MNCPATPQNPCMCRCHGTMVDSDSGERPLLGCKECENGQKLALESKR